jgi:hypothetical protein
MSKWFICIANYKVCSSIYKSILSIKCSKKDRKKDIESFAVARYNLFCFEQCFVSPVATHQDANKIEVLFVGVLTRHG